MVKAVQERKLAHDHFRIEKTYDFAPAIVFAAWADVKAKAQWWGGPDGWKDEHKLDFRIGGREWQRTTSPDGESYTFNGEYHDIVPDTRIVYSYTMDDNDRRLSASIASIEFNGAGSKTTLVIDETDIFFDGKGESDDRDGGTRMLLESLEKFLRTKT
ncbi:MAG: SRPBCC domain-containing protein [Candidatus Eremiobacterales bacterium]|jgi:uncharacterized protein YndB with AHSA1/START domain